MKDRGYERAAPFYDLFDAKDNADFFARYGVRAGEILDVGAGTGRIAVPLAQRGVRLVCVEPSPTMRRQFERKLAACPELRERIALVAADAASFDLGRTFPAAFFSGCFDHFLTRDEKLASLKNVARHLQPGGTLVFDLFLRLMEDAPLTPAGRVQDGDRQIRRFIARRRLSERRIALTLAYEIRRGDRLVERIEQHSQAGISNRAEVHDLLAETGFAVRREFSDYRFTPFEAGDDLLIVEAEKRVSR